MRRIMKENKGYSLVEMIIVIAIIAVMSAGAMVTITLINSAKAKEAGVTFESEVSNLVARSKSQVPEFELDTPGASVEKHKDYYFAIALYKDGDKYYIAEGYYNPAESVKEFSTFDCDNANNGRGKSISSRVSISYVAGSKNSGVTKAHIKVKQSGGTAEYKDYDDAYVIAFDKSGRCVCGVGTYEFNKATDNSTLDVVTVNANGSRQSK